MWCTGFVSSSEEIITIMTDPKEGVLTRSRIYKYLALEY